jgi:hypothetical protein
MAAIEFLVATPFWLESISRLVLVLFSVWKRTNNNQKTAKRQNSRHPHWIGVLQPDRSISDPFAVDVNRYRDHENNDHRYKSLGVVSVEIGDFGRQLYQ